MVPLFENVVKIYETLKSLQGTIIPEFLAHGTQGGGYMKIIVTSDEGRCITKEELDERHDEFYEYFLKIHNLSVKHGDLRLPNFSINDKYDIRIIDFGYSSIVEVGACID